jgi:hypothetical protein
VILGCGVSDRRNTLEIDVTAPADYLSQDPSPDELRLGKQTDLHGGAVPWWAFAKAVLRLHSIALWVARADGLAGRTRKWLAAGITIAAANLAGVGVYTVHRIEEAAVADERAAVLQRAVSEGRTEYLQRIAEVTSVLQRQVDELKLDVRELRRVLQRVTGRDPLRGKVDTSDPGPDSSVPTIEPDKLAWVLDIDSSM